MNKQELRQELLATRKAIPAQQRNDTANLLSFNVFQLPEFNQAKKIALYLPDNYEIDCLHILHQALRLKKECFLPVLSLTQRPSLLFAAYNLSTPLIHNRYGILEPDLDLTTLIAGNELDIIFVPVVGFDHLGWRLGRGGGFYDATFANLGNVNANTVPKLIGLAFDCQQVAVIPTDSWDWRLDAVVTESQILRFA
jgi:5-formyltetrahydrofolate cyclo-ligase